ncbi:MAG: vancomycin high temperature exclusion protein [Exilispira sp.]
MQKKIKPIIILFYLFIIITLLLLSFDLYITFSTQKFIYDDIFSLPNYQYCLLLGTSKYTVKNSINLYYKYRIESVKYLYENSKIKKIILSGDSRESNYDETKYMKKDLLRMKIPEDILIIDADGFRTIFSILNLYKKYNIDDVIVVSQRFHLERAIFIGRIFGLKLNGFAAKDIDGISKIKIQIRERGARIRLLLDLFLYFTNISL